ncbi:hypothetical protein E2986_11559 [Frieseomelitta varia]|uniref:Uncharacterized protein n=1 Tax=Frieseomelitta varia TaxID=561572 RepID=A0A833W127_9HYME|nr:hypothetical protein E2986_11559 [Frieseomelitta varia]
MIKKSFMVIHLIAILCQNEFKYANTIESRLSRFLNFRLLPADIFSVSLFRKICRLRLKDRLLFTRPQNEQRNSTVVECNYLFTYFQLSVHRICINHGIKISLERIPLGLSYLFNFVNLNLFLVYFLKPGDVIENDKPGLQTFCHSANTKYLIHMWRSLTIHLNTNIENYDLYNGKTPQEVTKKHDDNQRSWSFNVFSTKKSNRLKINPFEDVCIGVYIYSSNLHKYTVSMIQTREYTKAKEFIA